MVHVLLSAHDGVFDVVDHAGLHLRTRGEFHLLAFRDILGVSGGRERNEPVHLDVANDGLERWTEVEHLLAAVDHALLEQFDECIGDSHLTLLINGVVLG